MNSPSVKIFPGELNIAGVRLLSKETASKDFNGKKLTFVPDGNELDPKEEEYQKSANRIGLLVHKKNPESSGDSRLWMNIHEVRGSISSSKISKQTLTQNLHNTAVSKKEAQDLYRAFGVATPISHLIYRRVTAWQDFTKLSPLIQKCQQLEVSEATALTIRQMLNHPKLFDVNTESASGEKMTVADYVIQNRAFPDSLRCNSGTKVPLTGVPELLAMSKILGDPISLFEVGIIQSVNDNASFQVTKAGQGIPFQFPSLESNSGLLRFFSGNKAVNKDISIKDGKKTITIKWESLSREQQQKFLTVLLTADYLIKNGLLKEQIFHNSSGDLKYSGLEDYANMVAHFSLLSQAYDLENVRTHDKESHCAALTDAGWLCHQVGDDAQALFFINDAIERLGNEKGKDFTLLKAQVIKGIILSRQGNYNEARKWLMPIIDYCAENPEIVETRNEIIKRNFAPLKALPKFLLERPFPEVIDGVYELARCFERSPEEGVDPEESKWIANLLYLDYNRLHLCSSSNDALSESLLHALFYAASYCHEKQAYERQIAFLGELFKKYDHDRLLSYPNVSKEMKRKIIHMHYLLAEAYAHATIQQIPREIITPQERRSRAFHEYRTFLMLHELHLPVDENRANALHMMGKLLHARTFFKSAITAYRDSIRTYNYLSRSPNKISNVIQKKNEIRNLMKISYSMINKPVGEFNENEFNPSAHLKYITGVY